METLLLIVLIQTLVLFTCISLVYVPLSNLISTTTVAIYREIYSLSATRMLMYPLIHLLQMSIQN